MYEDSENIKEDRVKAVILTYIKSNVGRLYSGTLGTKQNFPAKSTTTVNLHTRDRSLNNPTVVKEG